MEFLVTAALLVATLKSLVDLAKRATGGDPKGALTQLLSYVFGFGLVLIVSKTPFAAAVTDFGVPLENASVATCAIIGLVIGGTAGFSKDVLKAIDNTQSEHVPQLFTAGPAPGSDRRGQ